MPAGSRGGNRAGHEGKLGVTVGQDDSYIWLIWMLELGRRDGVRRIRNLAWVFRLPTATDKFYPDFVVKRNDGRILVVEYKGDDCISNDDSKEKKNVGALWEERCHDKTALFLMAAKGI